jgi:hypothetical protein
MKINLKQKQNCIHCNYQLKASYKFCPNCSQKTEFKRLTLGRFIDDFFNSVISYDSKGINTIKSMLSKPGYTALNFVNGDTIKYVNPFRLYLYVSFLYFFISNLAETTREIFFEEGEIVKISELTEEKNAEKTSKPVFGKIFNTDFKPDSTKILNVKAFDTLKGIKKSLKITENFISFKEKFPDKSKEECFAELGFKDNFWNNYLYKKSDFSISNNQESLKEHFYNNVPLLLFFNIPIISLLLLLVQYKRPFNFTESMILMFHYMTIVFFILTFAKILDVIINDDLFSAIVFSIIMPIYFYKTIRNFYQQSRWKSIFKFVILSGMFFMSLIFMLIINLVFLFLTY